MTVNAGQSTQAKKAARPGAMTMAMQAVNLKLSGPKSLRIGLIRDGKIVQEKLFRDRKSVTVGSSERNEFVVHGPDLPARFEMFQLVGSDYILNFTDAMQGKVSLPAGVQELELLRKGGAARNAGKYWQVKLTDSSRGRISIGEVTLLFQFVTPPPISPKPQLPAAARGGFFKSIDWVFTCFVAFSFMLHFGFVIYLENADWPVSSGVAEIPESLARLVFQEPPPPEEPKEEEAAKEEVKEAPKVEAKPAPSEREAADVKTPSEDIAKSSEARAKFVEEAAQAAEAMLLGALGSEGSGALADVLAGGAVTGNAEDVLAQAAGVGVASGSSAGSLRTRTGGSGSQLGGLGSLAKAGGAGATSAQGEGGAVAERAVRGNAKVGDGGDIGGSGDFDAANVVKMIKLRIRAIQACYERELRRNPGLKGKVTVQFTIQESGSVTGVKITENSTSDDAVGMCVSSVVEKFRFNPGPDGGSVTFSYPFVFAPQS